MPIIGKGAARILGIDLDKVPEKTVPQWRLQMKEKTMSDEVKLLDARKSAIEEIIKVLDDEGCDSDDPTIKAIHSLIVSACKDAAGMGFDAGIKYKSYTTNSPASDL